jgi:DNA-binding PadR family transcriptional regulator
MKNDFSAFLPLSQATLHILLALATNDRHGYGIMQEVSSQSEGQYKLGPGTLYDNLEKLLEQGAVEEVDPREPEKDTRRRYYRLTGLGRRMLVAEIARLEDLIVTAKHRVQVPKPRRT